MATTKWTALETAENILTTELNSLGSGSNKITTTAISNDAAGEKNLYGIFELYIAAQGSNRTGTNVDVYLLPTMDGTNYSFGGDSLDPGNSNYKFSFELDTGALAARYAVVDGIQLPPCDFHVLVQNNTGQAFASSGNTLKFRRYGVEAV